MKSLFVFLLLALASNLTAADWPSVPFNEVRAYAFNEKGGPASIIEKGRINSTAIDPKGTALTAAQTKKLINSLTGKNPSSPAAACFNPRHAFVFYNEAKKPVAVVDICFECLGVHVQPKGSVSPYDFPALAELCAELKLKDAPDNDFRKWFEDFSKRRS